MTSLNYITKGYKMYDQVAAMYSLFITNVNILKDRFGKVYFPNPSIKLNYVDESPVTKSEFTKYSGFLFPILLFKGCGSDYGLLHGNSRYVYSKNENVTCLGLVLDIQDTYYLYIPIDLMTSDCRIEYTFMVHNVKCAKVQISYLDIFVELYIRFERWLYTKIHSVTECCFKSSMVVNVTDINISNRYDKTEEIMPKFQYLDKFGVIRHYNMLSDSYWDQKYVSSLYSMYENNIMLLYNDQYIFLNSHNILDMNISNTEWWDHLIFDEKSLMDSIQQYGIYFPIVYKDNSDGVYTIGDGLHRYFACRKLLLYGNDTAYLMIPEKISVEGSIDLYMPKQIFDRYSYMIKASIVSEINYESVIPSYIVNTNDTHSIRILRLLLERELNNMVEKKIFENFQIKAARYFNGRCKNETDNSRISWKRFSSITN